VSTQLIKGSCHRWCKDFVGRDKIAESGVRSQSNQSADWLVESVWIHMNKPYDFLYVRRNGKVVVSLAELIYKLSWVFLYCSLISYRWRHESKTLNKYRCWLQLFPCMCCMLKMKIISGEIVVSGRLAYVPQQPWIINSSLRDNILLGSDFHQDRLDTYVNSLTIVMHMTGTSMNHDVVMDKVFGIYNYLSRAHAGAWERLPVCNPLTRAKQFFSGEPKFFTLQLAAKIFFVFI